jgi:hypothetical protein
VDVPRPEYRSKIFGFLHALDVGGGMLAVLYSVILVMLGFPLQQIIFLTALPILVSSICLLPAKTRTKGSCAGLGNIVQDVKANDKASHDALVFTAVLIFVCTSVGASQCL